MNAIFKRPDIIPISIGYSCHVKVFCDMLLEMDNRRGVPRQPFDWLGTPMWTINEIVENDFADLVNPDLIKPRCRYRGDTTQFLTHEKYNAVYLHDFGKDITKIPEEVWKKVEEGYARRIERWHEVTKSGFPILFIRLEQDKKDRIEYPEFQRSQGSDEQFQVERFSDLMKAKGINCAVLYLSTTHPTGYNSEKRVCTVQFAKKDSKSIVGGDQIDRIVRANAGFIHKCLTALPPPSPFLGAENRQQIVTI